MTAKPQKQQPVVTLKIEPGIVLPAEKQAWRRWWAARVAEARSEAKNGRP